MRAATKSIFSSSVISMVVSCAISTNLYLGDEADLLISEGFIEPHFFAGFSGGRKSVLPGIASKKTVLWNHNAKFIANKNARAGSLAENPIHKDMLFAAKQAKLSFILNVIINGEKKVIEAFAGDLEQAHAYGCEKVLEIASSSFTIASFSIYISLPGM